MKNILIKILNLFAKLILKKYKPKIIGITGSVGKTSTKESIAAVLSFSYKIRKTDKNYNNEFGVPLTIIGSETGGSSVIGWLRVFYRAIKLLIFNIKYPQVLILEMGADAPGDISYLTELAPLNVGVLTAIGETHLHKFKNIDNVLKEKEKIVTKLTNGRAVINIDDKKVKTVIPKLKTKYYSYGFSEDADIIAFEMMFVGLDDNFCITQNEWNCKRWGTAFKANCQGSFVPFFLPHVLGRAQVYAGLAAIAVGLDFGMNLVDISESLRMYRPAKGRMNLIAGIKGSLIIDDTYNSSPMAVKEAIKIMDNINIKETAKKIAILGDMLELGEISDKMHQEIGELVANTEIDYLICVGKESENIAKGAKEAGMKPEFIKTFKKSQGVGNSIQYLIQSNDLILAKGSQGVRIEKIVKEIMAEPLKAKDLLVRQSKEWLKT